MSIKIHHTLKTWLAELEHEVRLLHSTDLKDEAQKNLVTFGVSACALDEWGEESILNFISGCKSLYASKTNGTSMQFYSWFDEQASQLRVSAVSSCHGKLPFGCELSLCTLAEIVNCLYTHDSGLYDKEHRLKVWCSDI